MTVSVRRRAVYPKTVDTKTPASELTPSRYVERLIEITPVAAAGYAATGYLPEEKTNDVRTTKQASPALSDGALGIAPSGGRAQLSETHRAQLVVRSEPMDNPPAEPRGSGATVPSSDPEHPWWDEPLDAPTELRPSTVILLTTIPIAVVTALLWWFA